MHKIIIMPIKNLKLELMFNIKRPMSNENMDFYGTSITTRYVRQDLEWSH